MPMFSYLVTYGKYCYYLMNENHITAIKPGILRLCINVF